MVWCSVSEPRELRVLLEKEREALRFLVGRRVAVARHEIGLSQRALAKVCDRSPSWVREIESGAQWAPAYLLVPLAEITGRSVGWFYGETQGAQVKSKTIKELTEEIEGMRASWALRQDADDRAIRLWQAQDPKDREQWWPDHADLCVWLMGELNQRAEEA